MNKFYKDEKAIIDWLDKYGVKKYTLIPDDKYGFVVNVSGNIYLSDQKLDFIPVKFNTVDGNFDFSDNELTSLEFCSNSVGGALICNNNKLISLEYCPSCISGSFDCSRNQLNSLEFCPDSVGGSFICDRNPKLGKLQKLTNFQQIYLEYREFLIEKFSHSLTSNLNKIASNKKSVKI